MKLSLTIAAFAFASAALAQGRTDYLNVETPQVKPIDVAVIDNIPYLLICNTADNSVEVWDIRGNQEAFEVRVPVGLEPCSVLYNPDRRVFYTTDFLSDSITRVSLFHKKNGALEYSIGETRNLGTSDTSIPVATETTRRDEPMDLALLPAHEAIAVTSSTASTVTFLDWWTLEPVDLGAGTEQVLLAVNGNSALKEPRRILANGDEVLALGFKGGSVDAGQMADAVPFDLDVVGIDAVNGTRRQWSGMGTTNAGMALADDGDLYVVGGFARNAALVAMGGTGVKNAETGFVEHMIWVSRGGAQAGTGPVQGRDLNEATPLVAGDDPVDYDDALANLRDIVIYEASGERKLFVAAMGSDRVAVLTDNDTHPDNWTLDRIDLTPAGAPLSFQRGPRGMVVKYGVPASNEPFLYVLNRITNSVSKIDPDTNMLLGEFDLNSDVTPAYITAGRPFLYNARYSANGFGSCASCHMDGRTDSLGWNLGDMGGYREPFDPETIDAPRNSDVQFVRDLVRDDFDPDKGTIVTQTLQGLVNFEGGGDSRDVMSNQPYHWRGDRLDFRSFNEGFVGILGRPDGNASGIFQPPPDRPNLPMGLPDAAMIVFRDFVESIHYPPNPHQPLNRRYSGNFGTDPDDAFDGSGALAGLKAFHTVPTLDGRSCVQCHQLPEGSNNVFSFKENDLPLETAAMRGLFQRERTLSINDGMNSPVVTGNLGLLVEGDSESLNAFEQRFAVFFRPPALPAQFDMTFLKNYAHEFDWGVAPMVGQVHSVGAVRTMEDLDRIGDFEAQAREANSALAVLVQIGSVGRTAYYYDPIARLYRPEPSGTPVDLPALLQPVSGIRDAAFFRTTPLGSERRVANLSGVASALPPSTITGGVLLPMKTNTANTLIPSITKNWIPDGTPDGLDFTHPHFDFAPSQRKIRHLQYAQTQDAQGAFGLTALRHDAPRRLRVAAFGMQHGAKLILGVWPTAQPQTTSPATLASRSLEIPLYATGEADEATSAPIWESAIELDKMQYLLLMAGGPNAPGVGRVLTLSPQSPEIPPVGTFDPVNWNLQHVALQNPGQAAVSFDWQELSIE